MKRTAAIGLGLVAGLYVSGCSVGASNPAPAPVPTTVKPTGYLAADAVPDAAAVIGAPPASGSASDTADVAIYAGTRKLEGQPRWALATRDAAISPQALLDDYACALGVSLNAGNAPALYHLVERATRDASATANRAKDVYRRPRPFVAHEGAICVARDEGLAKSFSYPSGHSTWSWTVGLILAELAPDRATPVLARARVYGESRIVCGVHYASDVQAGRTVASTLVARLSSDPVFRADLVRARAELAAARKAGRLPAPAPARCEADAAAAAQTW
jgi:acid phosphatase (class A)